MKSIWTRDSLVWTLAFASSILLFILGHTSLVPMGWEERIQDVAALLGFASGKLGMSILPHSGSNEPVKPAVLIGKDPKE